MTLNILIPVDGTEAADDLVPHVKHLVTDRQCRIMLVHVVRDLVGVVDTDVQSVLSKANEILDDCKLAFSKLECDLQTQILIGDCEEEILKQAILLPADLIVTITHARTGFARMVDGSVSERVLRRLSCPMLVTHRSEMHQQEIEPRVGLKNILVPVDRSFSALKIMPVVEKIARKASAKITIYHDKIGVDEPDIEGDDASFSEKLAAECSRLENAGFIVKRSETKYSNPVDDILSIAEENSIDMIAMTTLGKQGVRRVIGRSVTEQVMRRARCPVLVMCASEKRLLDFGEQYLG